MFFAHKALNGIMIPGKTDRKNIYVEQAMELYGFLIEALYRIMIFPVSSSRNYLCCEHAKPSFLELCFSHIKPYNSIAWAQHIYFSYVPSYSICATILCPSLLCVQDYYNIFFQAYIL